MANPKDYVIRGTDQRDLPAMLHLLKRSPYSHLHADWRLPSDWIDSPGFVVAEVEGHAGDLVGALSVVADPPPAAWVRLAALRRSGAAAILEALLREALPRVQLEGVTQVGWLAMREWPDDWLPSLDFREVNWITTYERATLDDLRHSSAIFEHRSATSSDAGELARLEAAAYEPLWRHSSQGLVRAMREALSFDVVVESGRALGFQYSVANRETQNAHLVRITVDPAAQGRGIGSYLLSLALEGYRRHGIHRATLNTQVDNVASQRLYEHYGFRCLGDRIPVWAIDL